MVKIKWALQRKRRRERETAMEDVQIKHLGHDHSLMPIKPEETDAGWDLTCYGCEQPISVSSSSSNYYGCKGCSFFLHKTCAEQPREMIHTSHPQHLLTLLADPRTLNYGGDAVCDICRKNCNRFTYHCSLCNYDIDMKCALVVLSIQRSIEHTSHPHKLIPLQKESMLLCDACGEEHKGTSFLCTTCGFWINQKCASSPLTLKLNNDSHHHTLSLIYFIPQGHDHCRICSKELYRRSWAYSCSECCYFVHLDCAVSDKEHSTNNKRETEELDSSNSVTAPSYDPTPINLPMFDDSVDIITQFIKNTRKQGKYKEAAEIKHSCHDHPLAYIDFEKTIDLAVSPSMSNLSSLLNGERNAGKCNGCAQSISAPFYHCVECNFSLHTWCAELPDELRHPGHPEHTLLLTMTNNYLSCDGCNLFQNIMYYVCSECSFFLDCKCASLPRVINHETHKHTLALRPTSISKCISCGVSSSVSYECGGCQHYLCLRQMTTFVKFARKELIPTVGSIIVGNATNIFIRNVSFP
ncbi:hypothetical protein Vadar_015436 [Vaccinium darrowii]|uniref:Uncharacterized protein n=1 Tax=Vaccinium darrowii TaxID=229202 RepID=A0ACB7YMD3_9ERIC|nr:hypothetical protein Vadar_015436 [Vaccinium darrowii]